jgi:PAS domain S-box-containing protein
LRGAFWPPLLAMTLLTALLLWQATEKLLLDMQTGRRGYVLSGGDRLYPAPYLAAKDKIEPAFRQLIGLVTDNPDQQSRALALLREEETWISPVKQHGDDWLPAPQTAALRTSMRQSNDQFQSLRNDFDRFIAEEDSLKIQRSEAVQRQARQLLGAGTLVAVLIGGLLAFNTRRHLGAVAQEYEAVLNAEQQARERLGTTLTSIGDGVLVTDVNGMITAMNPVAEALTGWTEAEARGKSAKVIFDIVNEETRHEVESPIARVIREGVVVGLANHTLLRRRDGSEIPIDDSGAPIRDNDGSLTGVVLVFRDISERHESERRRAFLADLSERTAHLSDPDALIQETVRSVGMFLGLLRFHYNDVDLVAGTCTLKPDWCWGQPLGPSSTTWPVADLGCGGSGRPERRTHGRHSRPDDRPANSRGL